MGMFFRKTPRRGKPLALMGLAAGLQKIERALERLNVVGPGNIQWSDGIPTIEIFGSDSGGSGDSLPTGGVQYQVLQRDGTGEAVWDYVRAH